MERAQRQVVKIYDTLTRQITPIAPRDGAIVRIYCCGPTVYRDAHLGNLRTFLLPDLVNRTLSYLGYQTLVVQNITDVGHMSDDFNEDKMLSQSKLEKRDPFEIAREYEARFHRDLAALNIIPADAYPRASESIELMVRHIERLIALGLAYQGEDGSVYFSAERFPTYGELSGNRLDSLKPGHRYEYTEDGAKRFHADWALWKAAGNRSEMVWDTPWGRGFPGWHIECSAMSLHFLDGHIDLHIGGIDLRFPHHENERAQSNPISGDEAVSVWLHGEHLLFEGRKMSKSAGNVVLVQDVTMRGFDPLAIRICFMENRYRSQMDLSWASIAAAHSFLRRLREKYQVWKKEVGKSTQNSDEVISEILTALCTDLDTPRALILVRNIEHNLNLSDGERREIIEKIDPLFGLDLLTMPDEKPISEEIRALLAERESARLQRDFAKSDTLRHQLDLLGISVSDTAEGQQWSWKVG